MVDVFTERSSTGFFGNLGSSIKSVLAGIVMFVASFPILFMNEGCINMGKVAQKAVAVSPDRPDPAHDGALVSVTQTLATQEQLSDPKYLKSGNWIALTRTAEMWAWDEKKETKTHKKIGGGSETETTYRYEKKWTSSPESSSSFRHPEGHTNPSPRERSESWTVREATVGAYGFAPGQTEGGFWGLGGGLPAASRLDLTSDVLSITPSGGNDPSQPRLLDGYLFLGVGTPADPQIGDTRISFQVVKPGGQVTLFGRQQGSRVEPFTVQGDDRLYRVLDGPREQAIQSMLTEHSIQTWIVRGLGFLLMWAGMCAVFAPLSAVMDVLPFLGNASRTVVSFVMFPIALVLSGVTIVVSMIVHNVVVLVIVMAAVLGLGLMMLKGRKPRAA